MSTISSGNQTTLPPQLLCDMGLSAGDRLAISREGRPANAQASSPTRP
jgi:hypothetical protein